MWQNRSNGKPAFLWQGVLIMLPVAVLATLGLFSLRQDKLLAQREAAERAQALADELLPKIWTELSEVRDTDFPLGRSFQVNATGGLLFPPPCPSLPSTRPPDLSELSAAQAGLWSAAQRSEATGDLAAGIEAYQNFLQSNPGRNFAAEAQYALGLLFIRQDKPPAAAERFNLLLDKFPDAIGESGLPLRPLVLWKLYELGRGTPSVSAPPHPVSLSTLCSNVVNCPSPVAEQLLARLGEESRTIDTAEVAKWRRTWVDHELARELFLAASPKLRPRAESPVLLSAFTRENGPAASDTGPQGETLPRLFWFNPNCADRPANSAAAASGPGPGEDSWLAIRFGGTATSHWYICRPEAEVGSRVTGLVERAKQVAEYFGVGLELAGRSVVRNAPDQRMWHEVSYLTKGAGGLRKEYLSELATNVLASATKFGARSDLLKVNVYLTSPDGLYKRQNARTFWFGSLIAAAALAALAGLVAAYRAFQRQLRLSEMKSNFVSSVSHELRAPIASMRLLAESLERGRIVEAPRQQEYFRFIVQECRRLSSLIENVLDFSRIEQGRKQYEFEPIDVVALVSQTVKLMQAYAAERGVKLELQPVNLQPSTSNFQLSADGKALQQALINLIDNGLKHSPQDETVTVGLEVRSAECAVRSGECGMRSGECGMRSETGRNRRTEDKGHTTEVSGIAAEDAPRSTLHAPRLSLWVEDHGEGIPPAEHEKIFERFYRRGSELRRETQGVGIGLSIVKHVVEAHGGQVVVRSDVGQGSRFTIELPLGTQETR